jgi:hypothetical protein
MSRVRVLLSFVFLLAGLSPVAAQSIDATPSAAAPGGMFTVNLEGLNPGTSYRLYLERGNPYTSRAQLRAFTAADTDATYKQTVPESTTSGAHFLVLYSVAIVETERARLAFSVGSPLTLGLLPTSAEPGKAVQYTVSGLSAGTLTLNYAGERVLGPIAVGEGSHSGKFIVPTDRPASIPATVVVEAVNQVGKFVAMRGKANFSVLARSGLPTIRSSFTTPPPTSVREGSLVEFSGRLQQPDGSGTRGRTSFVWRGSDGRVVPIDGDVQTDADGNYTARARAPSYYMDGVGAGSGRIVSVIRDEDPDTGAPRVTMTDTLRDMTAFGPATPDIGQFVIRLRGKNLLGQEGPIEGAYIKAYGGLDTVFSDPNDGTPPPSLQDFIAHQTQFTVDQVESGLSPAAALGGCPLNFGAKKTNAFGEALFEIDPAQLKQTVALNALKSMGEIRIIDQGAPIPGVDVFQDQIGGGQLKGTGGEEVYLTMQIFAGVKGFGETGLRDVDGSPDFPPYDMQPGIVPTNVLLAINLDTGAVRVDGPIGQFGTTTGSMTAPGVITVTMERINPDTTNDIVPYGLRIAGLAVPTGNQMKTFRGMHAYRDPVREDALWPDGYFSQRNVGREMRFTWDIGFGAVGGPKLRMKLPGDAAMRDYGTFALTAESACTLEGEVEYAIPLPDLTRLPVAPIPGEGMVAIAPCFYGEIVIDRTPVDAVQDFRICTRRPPPEMNVENPQLELSTFRIDARQTRYSGKLKLPQTGVTGDDPQMREYDLPPQENESMNDGAFAIAVDGTGAAIDDFDVSTEHIVGNTGTEGTGVGNPALFGFTGNQAARNKIDRTTVLDTGRIPLFRYPWGFSPIAGAVLGADLWLGADVGFYGTLGNPTGNGTMMDATIDPRLEGGVDLFFDLDILFGLVSASISALPSIDLTLKEVIGNGGLPDDRAGTCFGFDLDAELEICALFCASDRFNLFRAEDGDACVAAPFRDKAYGRGGFDLPRPPLRASAIAADAYGRELVVRVDGSDRLVATHMESMTRPVTRVIASKTTGVQHITLTYLASNRALAVWSESRLSAAELDTLMRGASGRTVVRGSIDDLARNQVLRYAYFDGTAWSSPQRVPSTQNGNVGKPQLAACRTGFSLTQCSPRSPRAYLVWEFDAASNIAAPDIEVWGSSFSPGTGFETAARLSATSGGSELQPDVAFLGTDPVVVWTTNRGAVYGDPSNRSLVVRVVDRAVPTTPIVPIPQSAGAGWGTIATRGADQVLVAFTRAQDGSLVGNRNALAVARGTCTETGCSFSVTEPRDPAGRQYRGERPSIAFDGTGEAVIQFRGLAYGPTPQGSVGLPTDTPGILLGTGDLLSLRVSDFSRSTTTVAAQNLSADGLMHWRPEFVFDPALDAFVGISQEVALPAGKHRALEFAKRFAPDGFKAVSRGKAIGDDGLVMRSLDSAPDLRIESLGTSVAWLEAGASGSYRVVVRNAGAAYDPAVHGTAVVTAAWDAPPGVGIKTVAATALAEPLASGARRVLDLQMKTPATHDRDALRTLYVEARMPAETMDANAEDNLATLQIGAMPVPAGIVARTKTDLGAIGLDWDAPADPRVAGYRIYKRAENGEMVPYGSTAVSGYQDVFAGFRNIEEYAVSSFSERGIESELSAVLMVGPDQAFAIFADDFEAAD